VAQLFDTVDMLFHALIVGGTGSGKTNCILYMLDLLFNKNVEDRDKPSLFLFDPAGDASIDLFRAIPRSAWGKVTILDPQYVTFGFNPLSLPEDLDPADEPEVLQAQVEEFSSLLSDVFNTDATNAPRLMWIFKGALYYLYTFTPDPTLWELYNIMLLFTKKSPQEVEELLRKRVKQGEIIRQTMEAISKLPQDAYSPVLNRISHFVLPPTSITFRMFCSRKSTVDPEKLMEPGRLTIFRIPTTLPGEFRKLFSAAVVMKLYFASLKRAKRLEDEGKPPTARTPVILAADEFRDVSQMRILRTILSQSRKFGLYIWMVVQTLAEVPDELLGSIQANVGPVLAFRGSPDDARKLAKMLYPQKTDAVETLIPGLEDYSALVRKRPLGGTPVGPPFRVSFPKLREPVHEYGEAIRYMKVEMEKAYGGTVGGRDFSYKKELDDSEKESGDCPLGYPLYWVPLTYLHRQPREVSFTEISGRFDDLHNWSVNTTRVALSWLVDHGRVTERLYPKRVKTYDRTTGRLVWKEPETGGGRKGERDVFYALTASAKRDFFEFGLNATERAGGPEHVETMRRTLEKLWENGYWCVWDKGDRSGRFPDILATPPVSSQVKGKEGKQVTILNPKDWDKKNRMAIEVETDPARNFKQLRENYDKNVSRWGWVRFVVRSDEHDLEARRILQDKDPHTFEVVVMEPGSGEDEEEETEKHDLIEPVVEKKEPHIGKPNEGEVVETGGLTPLRKREFWILLKVCKAGYPGRPALAKGTGVTSRQVTRYLDNLEERGLLKRDGNNYRATDAGTKMVSRLGWTFKDVSDTSSELKVDMD
jgi:DNA helicase HerA-like ATPase/predicted transcriptional regulator